MTSTRSLLTLVASIVAAVAVAAVIVTALVVRYGGPSGATLAVEACVDQASPASVFVPLESLSVDAVLSGDRSALEGWPLVASRLEAEYDVTDATETYWVIGTLDETSDVVCFVNFTDGALVVEPQFVDVAVFAPYQ